MRYFSILIVVIFGCFISSCSKEYEILESIESLSLTADNSNKIIGQTVSFTLVTNNGLNVTNEADFFVNNTLIEGNTFTSNVEGAFTVKAVYSGVTSQEITITFEDAAAINFVKRVLIEDYTGTWCGNCPRVVHAINLVKQQTSNHVPVAIHRVSSNPADATYDPFNFDSTALEATLNASGYPKAFLNRRTRWQPLEQNNVAQVVNLTQGENPKLGLAMTSNVSNGQINLEVKVKFSRDFENLKLVVYVLENGLIYDQENYTNFFGGINPIPNFVHDHTLRSCLTNIFGDEMTNTTLGSIYSRNFNIPIPSNVANANNLEFVAFVLNNDNRVVNVRKADRIETQNFEQF